MKPFLALLAVGLFGAGAVADGLPPPAPKGRKYVTVSHEVVLGKGVTGYVFVERVGGGFGPRAGAGTYKKLELSAEKARPMAAGGRRSPVSLLAVPQGATKEFKTDAELFDALKANKLKGVASVGFRNTALVPDTVKGDSVKWTHTITAIDDKGVKAKVEGEGAEQPKGRGRKDSPAAGEDSPDDVPAAPVAAAPRGGVWVAGLSAALGVMLGGFWLAGRARRKA
jgi:hypothetical protein